MQKRHVAMCMCKNKSFNLNHSQMTANWMISTKWFHITSSITPITIACLYRHFCLSLELRDWGYLTNGIISLYINIGYSEMVFQNFSVQTLPYKHNTILFCDIYINKTFFLIHHIRKWRKTKKKCVWLM